MFGFQFTFVINIFHLKNIFCSFSLFLIRRRTRMEVDSKFPSSEDRDLPEGNLFVPRKLQPELGRSGEVGVLRKPVGLRSSRSLDGSHGNEADSGQHCQVNKGLTLKL
jgi:hypothetical protein